MESAQCDVPQGPINDLKFCFFCFLILYITYTGLLIDRGKKVKFHGICRDKIAEKSADFAGVWREFWGQTWPKSNR